MKLTLLLILVVGLSSPAWSEAPATKRILIVVSNVVDMGDSESHDARNNLWEVAPPYHVFLSHGYAVDFVSPKGGAVEFSMDPVGISSYTIKYEGFLDRANDSLPPGEVVPRSYDGVFIGGGYGSLFDVASDEKLLSVIAQIYQAGGVVGACGHGSGGFANVVLSDGEFMVAEKRVAGFPNSTERTKSWAEQGELLPFLVEDQLRLNGAKIVN
ncbi:MAG: putative intracellular protease/amidase, partial [Halieaceae bacterium]